MRALFYRFICCVTSYHKLQWLRGTCLLTFYLFCLRPLQMSYHWPATEKILCADMNMLWRRRKIKHINHYSQGLKSKQKEMMGWGGGSREKRSRKFQRTCGTKCWRKSDVWLTKGAGLQTERKKQNIQRNRGIRGEENWELCSLRDGRVDSREGWGGGSGHRLPQSHAYKGVRIFAFWFVLK